MAKFEINGMDEIAASFEQLANITDADKLSVILPAARLLLGKQKQKIIQLFTQRTGDLANSLTIKEKMDDDGPSAVIYLKGKHKGSGTGKRKRKNGRSNGKYSGTNAEVGYILNYGSPRIAATHWLDNANDEAEEEVMETMQAAWDDVLESKGL